MSAGCVPGGFDLYFAYGSNLDWDDWSAFCRARGFDAAVLRAIGPAVLPHEQLVFDYRSVRRGGGALNIRSCRGGTVDGLLFSVPRDGWAALDRKEGHPHRYRREIVTVREQGGREAAAWVYRVIPAMRIGFCPPRDDYLRLCRAGRLRYGLSIRQLDAAAAGEPEEPQQFPRDES